MLLNKYFKRINQLQINPMRYLLYALGEIILIFTGITLSIWFTNWNERQKDKEVEVNILRELHSFATDLADITFNGKLREESNHACKLILRVIDQKLPYHDSLDVYFGRAFMLASFRPKGSAYENLKSRGVHTITNDSLRTLITNLHDVDYPGMTGGEERHGDLFFDILIQFNSTRFHKGNPYEPMKPLNFTKLMNDEQFRYYLNVIIFYNDFQLARGHEVEDRLRQVIKAIESELEK